MKHLFSFTAVMACLIIMFNACSYNNKHTSHKTNNPDPPIIYNDSIQSKFFGFSFGDSPQEVTKILRSVGLYTTDKIIPDGRLAFTPQYPQDNFSFGGYGWNHLYPCFSNNRLFAIQFLSAYKTKEGAASCYNSVLNSLSNKYNMQQELPSDTMTYGIYIGKTNNNQRVGIMYYRYESTGHQMWYGTELFYSDLNYYQGNSEL